jgi:hypothetical protein
LKENFKKEFDKERRRKRRRLFEPMIDYKYPTIASGATPIGSARRAPDDVFSLIMKQRRRKKISKASLLPSGGSLYQSRLNNLNIFRIETVKQGCDI